MEREDFRSMCAHEYHLYELSCAHTIAVAKEKVDELMYARRAAAIKRVEDRLARAQLAMRVEMQEKGEAALKKMVEDDLYGFEVDLQEYAKSSDPDINKVIVSARGLLQNFMSCRERFLEVLRRQRLAQEKMEAFMIVLNSMSADLQGKRRALGKLAKKQRETKVKKSGPSKAYIERERKIDELKQVVAAEESRGLEVMALYRQRKAQLDSINFSAQTLKLLVKEKDVRVTKYIQEMRKIESHLLRKVKTIKIEKEYILTFKNKTLYQLKVSDDRLKNLKKELRRIKKHKGEQLFHTTKNNTMPHS